MFLQPKLENKLVRLASIPHGTTVNAQGMPALETTGAPELGPRPITPYTIGDPKDVKVKDSERASNSNTARLPQDLGKFIEEGTITQDILSNPAVILTDINSQINITKTLTFSVTTMLPQTPGGVTANIAFLVGQTPSLGPNANAVQMESTFWVKTVKADITLPEYEPSEENGRLLL